MQHSITNQVDLWLEVNRLHLAQIGATITRSENWLDCGGIGAFLDIEVEDKLARLIVWSKGNAEVEVFHIETSERVFFDSIDSLTEFTLLEWISKLSRPD